MAKAPTPAAKAKRPAAHKRPAPDTGARQAGLPVTDPDAGAEADGSRPLAAADGKGGEAGPTTASPSDPAETAPHAYRVLSPLKWRGRRREIGETVVLSEAEAEMLVAIGVLAEDAG